MPITGKETTKHNPHVQAIMQTALAWPIVMSEGRMDTSQQPAVLMEPGPSVALPICHPLCVLQGTHTCPHTHTCVYVHTQPASQRMNQSSPALPRPPLTAFVAWLSKAADRPATARLSSSPQEPVWNSRSLIPVWPRGVIQASGPLPSPAVSPPGLTCRQADFLDAFLLSLVGQVRTMPFKLR